MASKINGKIALQSKFAQEVFGKEAGRLTRDAHGNWTSKARLNKQHYNF